MLWKIKSLFTLRMSKTAYGGATMMNIRKKIMRLALVGTIVLGTGSIMNDKEVKAETKKAGQFISYCGNGAVQK